MTPYINQAIVLGGMFLLCVGIVETLRFMALGVWRMFR